MHIIFKIKIEFDNMHNMHNKSIYILMRLRKLLLRIRINFIIVSFYFYLILITQYLERDDLA